jgi:hypothetical protein
VKRTRATLSSHVGKTVASLKKAAGVSERIDILFMITSSPALNIDEYLFSETHSIVICFSCSAAMIVESVLEEVETRGPESGKGLTTLPWADESTVVMWWYSIRCQTPSLNREYNVRSAFSSAASRRGGFSLVIPSSAKEGSYMNENWLQDYIFLAFRLHQVTETTYGSPFVEDY